MDEEKSSNAKDRKSRRIRKERFLDKQYQNWVGNIPPWPPAIRGPLIGGTVGFRGRRNDRRRRRRKVDNKAFPRRGRQMWSERSTPPQRLFRDGIDNPRDIIYRFRGDRCFVGEAEVMQRMGTDDDGYQASDVVETESVGSDRVGFSGPLSKRGSRKSARFNLPASSAAAGGDDEAYVEITLDVRDDTVAVHSVKPAAGAGGGEIEDPEMSLLARTLERRSASFGSSVIRTASSRIRQVSQELRRLASVTKRPIAGGKVDRSRSAAAHALKGLKFITKTDGAAGWLAVEKRFDELAADGALPRSLFAQCIGNYSLRPCTTAAAASSSSSNLGAKRMA
ncbi:hypothetical protein BHM03_00045130 [Ensete ventricosum]|nr:hypothetical protein BHM03_00045130 [Ensete ventricosum]